jgi:5'-nucleotidase
MRILLTNDDGFDSEGIIILEEVLKSYGHKISVCAPSHQRSASSQAVSLRESVHIYSYSKDHYHCSGTPADCLLYSFRSGLFDVDEFDLVISGINHGLNVSSDILYSGTVSAAKEAVIIGIRAIAISTQMPPENSEFNFKKSAIFLAEHLDDFYPLCTKNSLVNINVPHMSNGDWNTGALGFLDYRDAAEVTKGTLEEIKLESSDLNKITLGLKPLSHGPVLIDHGYESITDYELIKNNCISVSIIEVLPAISPLQEKLLKLEGCVK